MGSVRETPEDRIRRWGQQLETLLSEGVRHVNCRKTYERSYDDLYFADQTPKDEVKLEGERLINKMEAECG